jgi:hypothetical protein
MLTINRQALSARMFPITLTPVKLFTYLWMSRKSPEVTEKDAFPEDAPPALYSKKDIVYIQPTQPLPGLFNQPDKAVVRCAYTIYPCSFKALIYYDKNAFDKKEAVCYIMYK